MSKTKDAFWAQSVLQMFGLDIIEINVIKINPATNEIENDEALNTDIRVWIEIGYMGPLGGYESMGVDKLDWISYHHYKLDAGGRTFEEALIRSARKAQKYYRKVK